MNLRLPRIRLQTVFLLFFCAAVGLATYPHPLAALEPTIATAMVIGLLQQARQLQSVSIGDSRPALKFARQFALIWRICVIAVIAGCVLIALAHRGGMLPIDNEWRVVLLNTVLFPFTSISMTAVLCNSLGRWRSGQIEDVNRRPWNWLIWPFALTLGLLVIVHGSLIVFLVHDAMAGIEAAIPVRLHRPGVYPNLRGEGFRPFWLAAAATVALVGGSAMLIQLNRRARSKSIKLTGIAFAAMLLAFPVGFCYWYYFSEFHRLSPELAGAGLEATLANWLTSLLLAAGLITASAYWQARTNQWNCVIRDSLSPELDSEALHEAWPLLLLIAIQSGYLMVQVVVSMVQGGNSFPSRHPALFYLSWWYDPTILLVLAQAAAGLQLCWVRFQHRAQATPWVLYGLSKQDFFRSWATIALLLVVAIPTLNSFAFIAWLGPWNLRPLFGF